MKSQKILENISKNIIKKNMTAKLCPIEKKRRKSERAKKATQRENEVKQILENLDESMKQTYKYWIHHINYKKERQKQNSFIYRQRKKLIKNSEIIDAIMWDDLVCFE